MTDLLQGRRDALRDLACRSTTHAGLWLDRYLTRQTSGEQGISSEQKTEAQQARRKLILEASGIKLPEGYPQAFETWKESFDPGRSVFDAARARGRMVVGLGAKGALEAGLTLHRTWGVPYIPGSSLKGIAAMAADAFFEDPRWKRRFDTSKARPDERNAWDALFGDPEEMGAVLFHDAWLLPTSRYPYLHLDVMTVHHADYYAGKSESAGDDEDPNPVPFASVTGEFLVVVEALPGVSEDWLRAAWEALRLGLDRHGIGGKTNAGYGRLSLASWEDADSYQERQRERERQRQIEEDLRRKEEARRVKMRLEQEAEEKRRGVEALRARTEGVASFKEAIALLREVPGFGQALEAWAAKRTLPVGFEVLGRGDFSPRNDRKRELLEVPGLESLKGLLPQKSNLLAECIKLSRK
jgi:CRISPR-associated protein Cmr6